MNKRIKPYIDAFVFARGGSKGVPRKNIRILAGKPLIAYTIETGLRSEFINRVIVSTDDQEIADVALKYGADVPFMRPSELAGDDSSEWSAWQHAVVEMNRRPDRNTAKIFVSLPPTAPLRTAEDIDMCISVFNEIDVDVVITVKEAGRHPSFNMVALDNNGYAKILMPLNKTIQRRQDVPLAFDMTTVAYVTSTDYILKSDSLFDGRVKPVIIPVERALDIDTEYDFLIADLLLKRKNNLKCEGYDG